MSVAKLKSFLVIVLTASLLGCGATEDAEVQKITSNMRGLAVAYGQFTSQNRGRPPKDEAALRKFVETRMGGATYLESSGLSSLDEMFVSSRDGQPYVVIYGKPSKVVAYEQVGVDGKRYVAHDVGAVEELDEAAFAELVPDAK